MKERLDALRGALAEEGIDAMLITRPENRFYLSGFTGSAGSLVVSPDRAWLLTDFRYVEQAEGEAPAFEIVKVKGPYPPAIGELCERFGLKRLGFEADIMTYSDYRAYSDALPGELVPLKGVVERLRLVKDPAELAWIRRACEIVVEAWKRCLPALRAGVREVDFALELEFTMRRLGASGLSFDTIVASGPRSALPHGTASDRVMEEGDFVTVDTGCVFRGYCSDMTRTVVLGKPSAEQRRIYETVLRAQEAALAMVGPDRPAREVDLAARRVIEEAGYGDRFGHRTGHGVGIAVHEGPAVYHEADDVLRPGMVITVEPGIYVPGLGGVRIEDTVVVTEEGYENLIDVNKGLLEL